MQITELLYNGTASAREEAAQCLIETSDELLVIALIEDGLSQTLKDLKGKQQIPMLRRWSEGMRLLTVTGRSKPTSRLVEYAVLTRMRILLDMLQDYNAGILWGRVALEQLSPEQRHIIHEDLAIAHMMKRQNDLAEQHIKKAISLVPDGDQYWLARHHGNYGAALARAGRFAEAQAEFNTALELGKGLEDFDLREKFEADKILVERALEEEQ